MQQKIRCCTPSTIGRHATFFLQWGKSTPSGKVLYRDASNPHWPVFYGLGRPRTTRASTAYCAGNLRLLGILGLGLCTAELLRGKTPAPGLVPGACGARGLPGLLHAAQLSRNCCCPFWPPCNVVKCLTAKSAAAHRSLGRFLLRPAPPLNTRCRLSPGLGGRAGVYLRRGGCAVGRSCAAYLGGLALGSPALVCLLLGPPCAGTPGGSVTSMTTFSFIKGARATPGHGPAPWVRDDLPAVCLLAAFLLWMVLLSGTVPRWQPWQSRRTPLPAWGWGEDFVHLRAGAGRVCPAGAGGPAAKLPAKRGARTAHPWQALPPRLHGACCEPQPRFTGPHGGKACPSSSLRTHPPTCSTLLYSTHGAPRGRLLHRRRGTAALPLLFCVTNMPLVLQRHVGHAEVTAGRQYPGGGVKAAVQRAVVE